MLSLASPDANFGGAWLKPKATDPFGQPWCTFLTFMFEPFDAKLTALQYVTLVSLSGTSKFS